MDQQTGVNPIPIAIIAGQLVVGGAEKQLYLWLACLDRTRFTPVVVTLHPGFNDYWESRIEALSIPVFGIPRRRNRLGRLLEILHVLRPYHPKLIHGWHLFASAYAGAAAKLMGVKSLGSLRGSFQSFQNGHWESILSLALVDAIVVNSDSAGEQLKKIRKRKNQNVHVVVNAVEDPVNNRLEIRESLGLRLGISTDRLWIGSLGRLDANKHFDLLIKVMAMLQNDGEDFQFLLIGDGPDESRLKGMAEDLGIRTHVIFAHEIPDAGKLLSALDIFCFASLDEGLPNVIMEAAAAGVPIVSWRLPFIEELLDGGRAGLLVEPVGNIIHFKNMILNLIRSPELRIETGKAGRDHVTKKFSPGRFVQQMTDVYENVLIKSNGEKSWKQK
jgi:glycosyltransferase involved in cell wall biosynthesis